MYYQQDGAPARNLNQHLSLQNSLHIHMAINITVHVAHLTDLNPLDFFLWSYLKRNSKIH